MEILVNIFIGSPCEETEGDLSGFSNDGRKIQTERCGCLSVRTSIQKDRKTLEA